MSDFFVTLVFKISHPYGLLILNDFASLELEHSELNTDFMDGHYIAKGRITIIVKVMKLVWIKGKSLGVKNI